MIHPPENSFQQKALPPDPDRFIHLPQGIGELLMGEADHRLGKARQKAKRTPVYVGLGAVLGIMIGVGIGVFLFKSGLLIPILGTIFGIMGGGLGFRYSRAELRYRFVGSKGVSEQVFINDPSKKPTEHSFVFQPGMHLYTAENTDEQKHVGIVTEFDYRWRNGKTNVFQIRDKFITEHETAPGEAGYTWAKAAEKVWTDWLIAQTPAWKSSDNGIQFVVLGGILIQLFADRIRVEKAGESEDETFPPDSVKSVQISPTVVRFLHKAGPLEFPKDKFSDLAYFEWLVKDWYQWPVNHTKK